MLKYTSDFQLNWLSETGIQNEFQMEILVRTITKLPNSDIRVKRLSNIIDILHSTGKSSWIEKIIPFLDEETLIEKCLINIPYPNFNEGGEQMLSSSLSKLKKNINKINLLANYFYSSSTVEKETCSKSILEWLMAIIRIEKDNEFLHFKGYLVMTNISLSIRDTINTSRYFNKAKESLFNLSDSKRQEFAINEIMTLICKLDSPGYALGLAQRIKNDVIYLRALTEIVNYYTDLNEFDDAIRIAKDCRSPFLSGSLLKIVTEKMLKADMINEALLITKQKIPLESHPTIQLAIVDALCKKNNYKRALSIINEMWSTFDRDLAYQLLVVQMALTNIQEEFDTYVNKIQDSGIRADTLFKLYQQYSIYGLTDKLSFVWDEMLLTLKSISSWDKISFRAKNYIDTLLQENNLSRAREILYILLDKPRGQNSLLPSIESCIHSVIVEIVNNGSLDKAIQLLNQNYKGIKKDIQMYDVLKYLIKNWNEDGMSTIGQLFKSNQYKLLSSTIIAGYYANKGELDGDIMAISYLSDALQLEEQVMTPTDSLFESRFVQLMVTESMLPVLVKMEYWDDAINVIEKLILLDDKFDRILFLIGLLEKNYQKDNAEVIIQKLIKAISGFDLIKRLEVLTELAVILSRQNQHTKGKVLMLEVFAEYQQLVESEEKYKINVRIISGMATVLGHDTMYQFCKKSIPSKQRSKFLACLAIDCLKRADFDYMTFYLDLISEKAVYLTTLSKVVELCQSNNHKVEYRFYMDLSLKIYQDLEIQKLPDSILNHLMSIACKASDMKVIDSILLINKSASEQAKLINRIAEHLRKDIDFCSSDYLKRIVHPTLGMAYRTALIQGMSIKHINQGLLIRLLKLNTFSQEELEYLLYIYGIKAIFIEEHLSVSHIQLYQRINLDWAFNLNKSLLN